MLDSVRANAMVCNAVWRMFCTQLKIQSHWLLKFLILHYHCIMLFLFFFFFLVPSDCFVFAVEADRKLKAAKAAFDYSVDRGITFFDTAEVYGSWVKDRIIYILVYLFCILYLEYHL